MSTDEIRKELRDGLGIIILDRPGSFNVLSTKMLREIGEALSECEDDEAVRAVIITGGKHFSAGADIREMKEKDPEQAEDFSRLGQKVCDRIEDMPKPVIAAVNGYALGGGCEIVLACDIRIAGEHAKFGQPEINIGIIPGFGGTQRLSRLVGIGRAKEMILTGRSVDAEEALAKFIVGKVVKDDELMAKAEETAKEIAQKSPFALKCAKSLVNETRGREKALEFEVVSFSECFATEDHIEGMNAFLEKRRPRFKGV
ncbi:MAG: enoyl-CoA hydratase-related protein [Nitrospirae bacterium]|nr:enoyl-CoA hydratase-related protein [Nitrospirota bacterium]